MEPFELIFPINPKPKPRARTFVDKFGRMRATPKASRKRYENILAQMARLRYKNKPMEGPLRVDVIFFIVRPKKPKFKNFPAVRPDIDNYQKAFLDAMQGIIFLDDSQICGGECWKKYSEKEKGYIKAIFSKL